MRSSRDRGVVTAAIYFRPCQFAAIASPAIAASIAEITEL
jgi:hypothetical protein